MTTAPRSAFPPLEAGDFDARLDARAAARGIPTLSNPVKVGVAAVASPATSSEHVAGQGANAAANSVAETVAPAPVPVTRSRKPEKRAEPAKPPEDLMPTPRARMKSLNVELPDYVWVELKSRAAREMVCVRHVIMTLLQDAGIAVAEADMIEDGRRLR